MPVVSQTRLGGLSVQFLGFTTNRFVLNAKLTRDNRAFWPAGRSVLAFRPIHITQPIALGDLYIYIHNPAHVGINRHRLAPARRVQDRRAPSSSVRIPYVQLSTLMLGMFSTAMQAR